jgi:Na+/H+-dicarboxylate symporter/ABC-type amino acid transport substrate-binding protein
MSLSAQILVGLLGGIAAGLFFGESMGMFDIVGDAFIRLLQMAVLPYIVVSLVAGLGSLSPAGARRLAGRCGFVLMLLWAVAFAMVAVTPLCFPSLKSGSFFSPAMVEAGPEPDLVGLYIPANPFHALANNIVPAAVLFSIFLGVGLIGLEERKPLLASLAALSRALLRVTDFIVRLTPFGVFAISANVAGTSSVADLGRIQVYLVTYIVFSVVLALCILPALVAVLTPLRGRDIVYVSRGALITAFATGSVFVVLPLLAENSKQLLRASRAGSGDPDAAVDVVVPISQSFPHAAKVLSLSFVLFAGWTAAAPVAIGKYPLLAAAGVFSLFGSVNLAIPFLLDLMRIPVDTYELFVATGVINARFGTLLAAMHVLALTLVGTCALSGSLRVQWGRLGHFLASSALVAALAVIGCRALFGLTFDPTSRGAEIVERMRLPDDVVPATVYREPPPIPSLPEGITRLEAIYQRGTLRVGYQPDGKLPYAFFNANGELVGLDIELAHSLAGSLGVTLAFVPLAGGETLHETYAEQLDSGYCDIVMSGSAITLTRDSARLLVFSQPYLQTNAAYIVPDHRRREFVDAAALAQRSDLRIAVPDLSYYIDRVQRWVPRADLVPVGSTREFLEAPPGTFDAMIGSAEVLSAWSMLYPSFSVVVPEPGYQRVPMAYPLPASEPDWSSTVNSWIELKKGDGKIDRAYDYWILGKEAEPRAPRWSVLRDVLGWTD